MNTYLLIPFLTGQRRDGLGRVNDVSTHPWEIVDIPQFKETSISDANEKLHRMGHIYASLADKVQQSISLGNRPVCIAGDCFSALGVLAGLQKAGAAPDRIVWLDAHGDFHIWGTTISKYLGGMPLGMMVGRRDRREGGRDSVGAFINTIGLTAYPEENIVLSDARDLDPGEKEALESSNIVTCKIENIHQYLSHRENIHLHFDTDVIDDRAKLPALKYHVNQGPSREDILSLFRTLRQYKLTAISVSAWHEEHDMDNKTAISCLSLLKELE
ncbi:arginase family protein [Undibacterium pigrum]|uniref:Arginase n=1 Tax=Undibacterium pigrum TaxID=401470 RepID=A0A318JEK8_9BURK|nr:arginase family protein [Undibacterium pigrum]PXX46996.1 arginase [Undibacterium pigrum]